MGVAGGVVAVFYMPCLYHDWLVLWNMAFMTFHILGIIIPTDNHIFQRGGNTINQMISFEKFHISSV